MQISKSTYELLTPIIAAIDKTFTIQSVVELVPYVAVPEVIGSYKLNTCDTLWATQGFPIEINGEDYKITSIIPNEYIIISGTVLPTIGTFTLYPPIFYHGSIKVAEAGLNEKVNGNLLSSDKMPMIWLHEPVEERVSFNLENPIYKYSPCDLYFMIDANFSQWSQDDHYTQAIKPIRQLIDRFWRAMKVSGLVDDNLIEDIGVTDLPRFGRYTAENGAAKTVFAQYEMSGTKLKIEIPFIRNQKNCC